MKKVEDYVRTIPDFPEEGIMFRDVTSVLQDADGLQLAIQGVEKLLEGVEYDVVVGPESRGFIFGCPVANKLGVGFVPIRKPGKLPRATIDEKYDLEYGSNVLSIHEDAIKAGDKVVIIDDLLATGGTLKATCNIAEKLGAEVVGISCLIELEALNGRSLLDGYDVYTIIKY